MLLIRQIGTCLDELDKCNDEAPDSTIVVAWETAIAGKDEPSVNEPALGVLDRERSVVDDVLSHDSTSCFLSCGEND